MARTAGFGAVVSVRESFVNLALRELFAGDLGPYFFRLPKTVMVGGHTVAFAGLGQLASPRVVMHDNPHNIVTGHLSFYSTFNAQVDGGAVQRWQVRLDGTASAAFTISVQNEQIMLGLDPSNSTLQPLQVLDLLGTLPGPVLEALQSSSLAEAATTLVRSLPTLPIRALMPSHLSHTQPGTFKDSSFSEFNWFTIDLAVSRTIVRIHDGAATVGADFAGMTLGDPSQLTDLTRTGGTGVVYVQTVTQATLPNDQPILLPKVYSPDCDVALSFSIGVLSQIVANQMSPQIAGTPVSKEAVLNWIQAGYSRFEKPLRGWEDGLHLHINATAKGIDADIHVYLQPFLRTYEGPTNFLRDDSWAFFVGRVDIEIPWWAELAIGIAEVLMLMVSVVVMLPLLILQSKGLFPMWLKFMDDTYNTFSSADPANIAAAQRLTLQGAAYGTDIPAAQYISVGPDTIDVGRRVEALVLPGEPTPTGGATLTPATWWAYDQAPIQTSVILNGSWKNLASTNLVSAWEVRRADTNAVIVSAVVPYAPGQGAGIAIPHHSQELYLVSDYIVRCTLTATIAGQAGEIWSGEQALHVADSFDRAHAFVEWGPKRVYFRNGGTGRRAWTRISRSRIHRTAVAARCQMVRVAAGMREDAASFNAISSSTQFRYLDLLPFPWQELNDHRTILCEYCFFGGPDKTAPFPQEDWFSS